MPREKLYGTPSRFRPDKVTRLSESVVASDGRKHGGLMILEGIIQNFIKTNANGRRYPKRLWERSLKSKEFTERLNNGDVIGLLEHPEDSLTKYDRSPSHRMLEARMQDNGDIWGRVLILDTRAGREIAGMVEGGCSIGISSRGEGEVSIVEGVQEVNPDTFILDTWDLVHDNSVPGARLKPQGGGFATPFGESIGTAGSSSAVIPTAPQSGASSTPVADDNTDEGKLAALQKKLDDLNKSGAATQSDIADLTKRIADAKTRQLSQKPTTESRNSKTSMSKLSEMRKAGLDVRRLAESVKLAKTFHDRTALSEQAADLRRHIKALREEDEGVVAQADAATKELDKVDKELDKADEPKAHDATKLADVLTDVVCTLCPDCGEKQEEVKKTVAAIVKKVEAGEEVDVSEALKGVMGSEADPDVTAAFKKGDEAKMIDAAESLIRTLTGRVKVAESRVKALESVRTTGDSSALAVAKAEVVEAKKNIRESITEIERLRAAVKDKDGLLVEATKKLKESVTTVKKEHGGEQIKKLKEENPGYTVVNLSTHEGKLPAGDLIVEEAHNPKTPEHHGELAKHGETANLILVAEDPAKLPESLRETVVANESKKVKARKVVLKEEFAPYASADDVNLEPSLHEENEGLRNLLQLGADKVVALSQALKTALDLLGGAKVEHNLDASIIDLGEDETAPAPAPEVKPEETKPPEAAPAPTPPPELEPELNESLMSFRRNRRPSLRG